MRSLYEGTGVAQVTPFLYNKVDYTSLKNLIERNIQCGAKAIIILATTGEGTAINLSERINITKFCKDTIAGRAKLIVGTGNNNFDTCFENTKLAKQMGADGALVVTPYYNKTTQAGLLNYYAQLAKLEFPMIAYNVPSRTGLMLELPTISALANNNNFIYGIKESTTDISRIQKLCRICENKIPVYSGEDALNYVFYCLGGRGSVSVTANAYPDKVEKIYQLTKENRFEEARKLQSKLAPIDEILFCETNPIPIKHYLSLMHLAKDEVRMPLVPLSTENKEKMQTIYNNFSAKSLSTSQQNEKGLNQLNIK